MIPFDEVKCMLCGKRMKSVEASHLWHKHGITTKQYERMFPCAPRVSIWTLRKLGRYEEAQELFNKWKRGELCYGEDGKIPTSLEVTSMDGNEYGYILRTIKSITENIRAWDYRDTLSRIASILRNRYNIEPVDIVAAICMIEKGKYQYANILLNRALKDLVKIGREKGLLR